MPHRVDALKPPAVINPLYRKRMGDEETSATNPLVDKMIGRSIVTSISEEMNDSSPSIEASIEETDMDSTGDSCTTAPKSVCTSQSPSFAGTGGPTKRKARFREDELTAIQDEEEDEDSFHTGHEFSELEERHDCAEDADEGRDVMKDFDVSMNLRGLTELSKEMSPADMSPTEMSPTASKPPKPPKKPPSAEEDSLPQFELSQLERGDLLREGNFSDVYALTKIINTNAKHRRQQDDDSEMEDYHSQFAVKLLRPSNAADPSWFKGGASKFAAECKMLYHLDHPNIMKIYGESVTSLTEFSAGKALYYFIIEDQLKETLDKRIHGAWRTTYLDLRKRRSPSLGKIKMFGKKKEKESHDRRVERKEFLLMRLGIAVDIASALAHLHSHNIVCRDVRPANIGLDAFGEVKLFNLGLAKELVPDLRARGKLCKIKGAVGSMRYMAPEMFLGQPYGFLSDAYSFSILLWEILSLKKPFANMTPNKHTLLVVKGNERPSINLSLSFRLRSLMKRGWAKRPKERPKMKTIIKELEKEIQQRESSSLSSEGSFASRRSLLSSASFASFASILSNESNWLVEEEEDMHASSTTYDTFMNSSSTTFLDSDAGIAS